MIDFEKYEIANEGYNIDTLKAIKGSKEYKDLVAAMNKAKSLNKDANKSKDFKKFKAAADAYKEAGECAVALKEFINKQREPVGFFEKLCSHLTPIFDFKFPEVEVGMDRQDILATGLSLAANALGGNGGGTIYYHTKTYGDKDSMTTGSDVKSSYHKRMNLLIKRITIKHKEMMTQAERNEPAIMFERVE